MLVKFVLTMEDAIVMGCIYDELIISWEDDVSQEKIMELSHRWITSTNFLTSRLDGLEKVGQSSLQIKPIEDIPDFHIPM